jgi:dihydroorotase
MDLILEGNVYYNHSFTKCCIGIKQGKIVAIKKSLKGDSHYNFGTNLLLPAGVDIHVHFRDPGFVHKEDFFTGSKAAAFGGITCAYDMPNTKPMTSTMKSLLEKIKSANSKSVIDFGIYTAITNNNLAHLYEFSKHSNGFKIFLGKTTDSHSLDEQKIEEVFAQISKTNQITLIHAENEKCLQKNNHIAENLKDHLTTRPSECEEKAILSIIQSSRNSQSKVHICHLSSCEGFELLRKKPKNFSVGVTPHHLLFDIGSIKSNQSFYKVNPPIRSHFDRETLWYGLTHGFIDILESDHAPHTLDEKMTDFNAAPSGMPGVETLYPLFLAVTKKQRLSIARLISLLCERPATLLNVPKGKIEIGRDADIIVIDYKKTTLVKGESLHSKCGWTPYEGKHAIFPSNVFLRGERIIEDGELTVPPGFGNHIPPRFQ